MQPCVLLLSMTSDIYGNYLGLVLFSIFCMHVILESVASFYASLAIRTELIYWKYYCVINLKPHASKHIFCTTVLSQCWGHHGTRQPYWRSSRTIGLIFCIVHAYGCAKVKKKKKLNIPKSVWGSGLTHTITSMLCKLHTSSWNNIWYKLMEEQTTY